MIQCERKGANGPVKVTFSVPAGEPGQRISVAGDFNGWAFGTTSLRKRGDKLKASVVLHPGRRYAFRYVTADGRWFDDDEAHAYEPNEFGGTNGIVDLTQAPDS